MERETALNVTWTDRRTADRDRRPSPERAPSCMERMISRKVLFVATGLLAFLAVALNVKLVVDLSGEAARGAIYEELHGGIGANAGHPEGFKGDSRTLTQFRNRVAVLLGIIVACGALLAYLVLGRVLGPIRSISRGALDIASGRLDVTVPSQGGDEIATLGAAVNEIAANYQEVLLLTGTHAGRCLFAMEAMEKTLKDEKGQAAMEFERHATLFKRELALIADMMQGFRFYDAHFNGREVVRRSPE